jgi:hypothetical protein
MRASIYPAPRSFPPRSPPTPAKASMWSVPSPPLAPSPRSIGTGQQAHPECAGVDPGAVLPAVVRLRGVPRGRADAPARARARDGVRVQALQEGVPEGPARVRRERRVLPALRQPLRPRGEDAAGAHRRRGRRHPHGRPVRACAPRILQLLIATRACRMLKDERVKPDPTRMLGGRDQSDVLG